MYYVFYSTRGKYQVCTFNPYKYSHWCENLIDCVTTDLRTDSFTYRDITTPETRIASFNQALSGGASCFLVAQVDSLADLLDLYPELFI